MILKRTINYVILLMMLPILAACGTGGNSSAEYNQPVYKPQFANGLRILGNGYGNSVMLKTLTPWQGADTVQSPTLFIQRGNDPVTSGFTGQVLKGDAKRIVCMSSSYVAMLDALGAVDRVVGVSGIDFISNKYIQNNRDKIVDVGYDGNIDYEKLVALNPDLVILYGVGGASVMEPKLKELHIPYVYLGEYTEESPLGKAEWLVAIGELVGKRHEAEKYIAELVPRYQHLKSLADGAKQKPKVMVNTPYSDQWLMPSTASYGVKLIQDAGAEYIYPENNTDKSQPIDMEKAWLLASQADCWINLGQITTKQELIRQLPRFADSNPVKQGQLWNTTLHVTPGGGNDYWESGIVHPDLVLQDLIKIFHPELLTDRPFSYYKQLQ